MLRLLVTMATLTEPFSRVLCAEPAGNQYRSVVVQVRQCGQRSMDGPIKIYRPEWLRQRCHHPPVVRARPPCISRTNPDTFHADVVSLGGCRLGLHQSGERLYSIGPFGSTYFRWARAELLRPDAFLLAGSGSISGTADALAWKRAPLTACSLNHVGVLSSLSCPPARKSNIVTTTERSKIIRAP